MLSRNVRVPLALCILALCASCERTANFAVAQESISSNGDKPASSLESSSQRTERKRQRAAEIEKLIKQLGSEQFNTREEAEKKLAEFGNGARKELTTALNNSDVEIASRAERLIRLLPELTHTVVDALGQPIAEANVTVKLISRTDKDEILSQVVQASGEAGEIAIPDPQATPGPPRAQLDNQPSAMRLTVVELHHPDYGSGLYEISFPREKALKFPLVAAGTEARKRALEGTVVDPDGKPVPRADLECSEVRTPGMGLITGDHPMGHAMTDEAGRFAYYLPNKNRGGRPNTLNPPEERQPERGELIPMNSNFQISVTVPESEFLFPTRGSYSNLAPVEIRLAVAKKFHRFRFEDKDGNRIDSMLLAHTSISLDRDAAGKQEHIPLGHPSIQYGRRLISGKYTAQIFAGGNSTRYLPIDVTDDSPEELIFRLPRPKVFRGQVVHGVTGKPLAGALVIGYNATSKNNLALLSAKSWAKLREMAALELGEIARTDHPLRPHYAVQALVQTDENGQFEVTQRPDMEFYGLIALAEDYVPFHVRIGSLKIDGTGPIDAGEFPLFPAAKVLVRPVHEGEQLAVSPKWILEDAEQPEWIDRFRRATSGQNREFAYEHWMTINESQPLYVPADVRLRLRFETPYDAWTPTELETPIQLSAGKTQEIGDIKFAPALAAKVRVLDEQGKPLEGIPVRRFHNNMGSVAHNTDAQGYAYFNVYPKSRGQFRVSDIRTKAGQDKSKNLGVDFETTDAAPAKPFEIKLTAEQREFFLKASESVPRN